MFGVFSMLIESLRQDRAAVRAAVRHFEMGGERAHWSMCRVIATRPGYVIVRVCFGSTKPRMCAWYRVSGADSVIRELTAKEAEQYGEQPQF
jgi:hypothetical protein